MQHPDPQRSDNWGKSYLSDVLTHCLSISRSQRPSLLDLNVRLAPSHIRIEWTGVESQSVTDAVAIFHDAHVEIHSLNGHEVWQFGIYTSEQVANLVLSDRGFDTSVVNDLTACGARSLMVLLDFVTRNGSWTPKHQRRLHKLMRMIVLRGHGSKILPPSFYLGQIQVEGNHPIGGGAYADTWKARVNDTPVCLKALRTFVEASELDREKALRTLLNEAIIWRQLHHPRVLRFLGISEDCFPGRTSFVSPFMVNGDLMMFLKRNPDHDRITSLLEAAQGLEYLHNTHIYHGDMKGANILVDEHKRCCLADFGISSIISTQTATAGWANATTSVKGSLRWMAPELLDVQHGKTTSTAARDIYAFGCTMVEVITGRCPFSHVNDAQALLAVLRGERPSRPQIDCVSDLVWNLMERCWKQDADERPWCGDIVAELLSIARPLESSDFSPSGDDASTSVNYGDEFVIPHSFKPLQVAPVWGVDPLPPSPTVSRPFTRQITDNQIDLLSLFHPYHPNISSTPPFVSPQQFDSGLSIPPLSRERFTRTWHDYCAKNDIGQWWHPTDMYSLHCEVMKCGGEPSVSNNGLWSYIGGQMGSAPSHPVWSKLRESAANQLQSLYHDSCLIFFDALYRKSLLPRSEPQYGSSSSMSSHHAPSDQPHANILSTRSTRRKRPDEAFLESEVSAETKKRRLHFSDRPLKSSGTLSQIGLYPLPEQLQDPRVYQTKTLDRT